LEAEQFRTDIRPLDTVPVCSDPLPDSVLGLSEQSCDAGYGLGWRWTHAHPGGAVPGAVPRQVVPPCLGAGVVGVPGHVRVPHGPVEPPNLVGEGCARHTGTIRHIDDAPTGETPSLGEPYKSCSRPDTLREPCPRTSQPKWS